MTANKPATPLPWSISPDGRKWIYCDATKDHIFLGNAVTKTDGEDEIAIPNAAYLVHAANAYPKLITALKRATMDETVDVGGCLKLLRELGEAE